MGEGGEGRGREGGQEMSLKNKPSFLPLDCLYALSDLPYGPAL